MKKLAALASLLLAGCGGTVSVTQHGPFGPVVFVGDALTEKWPLPATYQDMQVVNQGRAGDTSAAMLARFQDDVLDQRPTFVVIEAPDLESVPTMVTQAKNAAVQCVIVELIDGQTMPGYDTVDFTGIEGDYAAMWAVVEPALDECYRERTF